MVVSVCPSLTFLQYSLHCHNCQQCIIDNTLSAMHKCVMFVTCIFLQEVICDDTVIIGILIIALP